jgi:hypothetical protein
MIDSMTLLDLGFEIRPELYELEVALQDYVENIIEMTSEVGVARDYALAFLSDVNWWEIATHMISDHDRNQEAA